VQREAKSRRGDNAARARGFRSQSLRSLRIVRVHFSSVAHDGISYARARRLSVDQHGAHPAGALFAAQMGCGRLQCSRTKSARWSEKACGLSDARWPHELKSGGLHAVSVLATRAAASSIRGKDALRRERQVVHLRAEEAQGIVCSRNDDGGRSDRDFARMQHRACRRDGSHHTYCPHPRRKRSSSLRRTQTPMPNFDIGCAFWRRKSSVSIVPIFRLIATLRGCKREVAALCNRMWTDKAGGGIARAFVLQSAQCAARVGSA
jgi:hypothetical protein